MLGGAQNERSRPSAGRDQPGFWELGLIGYPLGHSRSPGLHQAGLAAAGLAGAYRLYVIPPDQTGRAQIATLLGRLRSGEIHGLNVTIPHKQTVMAFLDRLSPVAQAVGAVNTLYRSQDGLLAGENFDVPGFLTDVRRLTGTGAGTALVLGAGGSARAVVYGLSQAGWQVRVLARKPEQAAVLAETLGTAGRCSSGTLDRAELEQSRGRCDLLVNTTPLGMHPDVNGCPWPADLPLPDGAVVYDLVYNPAETVLVRRARAQGLAADTGVGMLVSQAALAFAQWTGLDAPFDIMHNAFSL